MCFNKLSAIIKKPLMVFFSNSNWILRNTDSKSYVAHYGCELTSRGVEEFRLAI